MSNTKQKRKVALDYLLDGKDRLTNGMNINYVRQYREFLFSDQNVLKNIQAANELIQKSDRVMNSMDNFKKKEQQDRPSIYATYFSKQGNTAPISPNKNNHEQNKQTTDLNQNNLTISNQMQESNQSPLSNKANALLNDLLNSQIMNQSLLRDDKLFIDSVQQSNLQSMKMHDALRLKQLKEKTYNTNKLSTKTGQIQKTVKSESSGQLAKNGQSLKNNEFSNTVNSLSTFVPYGNERNSLGFIIDPITQYGIEQQNLIKRLSCNFPIEKQRISLVVPPSADKVLVIKRGVHFFDKGIKLRSIRDDNLIQLNLKQKEKTRSNGNSYLNSLSKNQLSSQNLLDEQEDQIANNINIHRIHSDDNPSILSTQQYPGGCPSTTISNSIQQQQNLSGENSLLKIGKGKINLQKSELNSSNYLVSNTTTFHNSTQQRNYSQDSVLPSIDNNKLENLKKGTNSQLPQFYITPSLNSPSKYPDVNEQESDLQQSSNQNQSQSQLFQGNPTLQFISPDNLKHSQTQLCLSQPQYDQSQASLCANPSCTNNASMQEVNANENQETKKVRKNLSLVNIKIPSSNNLLPNQINSNQTSKTMQFDKKDQKKKLLSRNDVVVEEKLDGSTLMNINSDSENNIITNKYMEVKMKQNKGGQVSEFHLGQFVLSAPEIEEEEDKNQKETDILIDVDIQDQQPVKQKRQASPSKKLSYNKNVHFKWKMNAQDEAQLFELMKEEKQSQVKLPKISIYNKSKYVSNEYPAPGGYNPSYACIEKHTRLVFFDKANSISNKQNNASLQNDSRKNNITLISPSHIPKSKSQLGLPKYIPIYNGKNNANKEEGHEIMFSELMKDIKKEVRNQKMQNKELQHPMNGLLLSAIPHANIIELNKDINNRMNYCKSCLNNIKYYLRADNPQLQRKQMYVSRNQ